MNKSKNQQQRFVITGSSIAKEDCYQFIELGITEEFNALQLVIEIQSIICILKE